MPAILETFSLALKINNHQLRFTIDFHDDQHALFQKLVKLYPQCKNQKNEVLAKLKKDLQSKVKSDNVKPELKATIETFLKKTFSEEEDGQSLDIPAKKQIEGIQFRTKSELSPTKLTQQQYLLQGMKKAPQYSPTFKKQALQNKKTASKQKLRTHSEKKKEGQNEDVVKACQVILQKTNQTDMKEMARKYLEDIGRLPNDEKRKEKVLSVRKTEEKMESAIDQTVTEPISEIKISENTPEVNDRRFQNTRSPIFLLNKQTTHAKNGYQQYVDNFMRNGSIEANTRSFRANKYDYLSSIEEMQTSTEMIKGSSYHPSLRNSRSRQKRFSYLLNFNS